MEKSQNSLKKGQFKKESHTVSLKPIEEGWYAALRDEGFVDGGMLTLAGPLGKRVGKEWLESEIKRGCAAVGKKYGVKFQYRAVLNRGYSGNGEWSAHLIWKHVVPTRARSLVAWWNRRNGRDRAKMSSHSQGARYWAKNMGEPDSFTLDSPHNRKKGPRRNRPGRRRVLEL